jgi:hypothetical protein
VKDSENKNKIGRINEGENKVIRRPGVGRRDEYKTK